MGDSRVEVRHPEIVVHLTEVDGNAFAVAGAVVTALKEAGLPLAEVNVFREEALGGGDYDHLLQTCMKWVTVE